MLEPAVIIDFVRGEQLYGGLANYTIKQAVKKRSSV